MIGGGSKVNLDVPPYFIVDGVPARAVGMNVLGLRRAEAAAEIGSMGNALAERLADVVRSSDRGICHARRRSAEDEGRRLR